jgi:hypothetical protein
VAAAATLCLCTCAMSCWSRDIACSLKNLALNGATGSVRTSAEDGRVTVVLIVAHPDLLKAYPRGVKVKVSNCKELDQSEKADVNPKMIFEALMKHDKAMETHPDPAVAHAHQVMNAQAKDPSLFKATLAARRSNPNVQAMLAKLGSQEERDRFEKIVEMALSSTPDDLQALMDRIHLPSNGCVQLAAASSSNLQTGQRAVALGLSSQWLNGATCCVARTPDAVSGRCLVRVLAPPDAVKRSKGAVLLKPENLQPVAWSRPRIDQSAQWLDEHGWVCSKAIDYGATCPKSHDLVPMDGFSQQSGLCSACGESEVADVWSCCGGCSYRVCGACRALFLQQRGLTSSPHDDANDRSTDFPMLVSDARGCQYWCVAAVCCIMHGKP